MTGTKTIKKQHLEERDISDYLDKLLDAESRKTVELHAAQCPDCLTAIVSAYESVKLFKKRKDNTVKKLNMYLVLAIVSFLLSFAIPQYFAQFLVATVLLGIKWISDSRSTNMLVAIYDAWKHGGEKETSRILNTLDKSVKNRL